VDFIRKSLGRKLAFVYGGLLVAVLAVAYQYAAAGVEARALLLLEESLTEQAFLAGRVVMPVLARDADRAGLQPLVRELGGRIKARMTLIDADGKVLADSEMSPRELLTAENHRHRPEFHAALLGQTGANVRHSSTLGVDMLYVAVPLQSGPDRTGALRLAWPLGMVHELLYSVAHPLVMGSLAGMILVLGVSLLWSRAISRRVGTLAEAAVRYGKGDFSRKVPMRSGDELELLAGTMNQMAATLRERIAELEEEKAKFSAIVANMAEGVIAVYRANRVLIVNPSAGKIFGIVPESSCGRAFIEVIRNKRLSEMMAEAVENQNFIETELELPQWGGKVLRVGALGISRSEEAVAGLLVISDISEMRRLEKIRREFVANVSHELRTPLTSIRGFIETFLSGKVTEPSRSREFLERMEEDAVRLTKLIDDLLDLSRIEARESSLNREPLVLADLVDKVLVSLKPCLESKDITVENHLAECRDLCVLADADALKQVFVNLLDNAVKFNKPGGKVILRAGRQKGHAVISVEDTGCGIPEAMQERVFERFFRADPARSRDLGGTGLGLSILKHIVEAHGGKVSCTSRLDYGSTFTVTLPAA